MSRKRIGRPSKLTPEVKKRLIDAIKAGNYIEPACRFAGIAPATTVHHILHVENRPDLALDDDNLLSVCAACHNREHPERFIHRIMEPKRNKLAERFPERW
mgnify:CR=1 FL=1